MSIIDALTKTGMEHAAGNASNSADILGKLGVSGSGYNYKALRKRADELGVELPGRGPRGDFVYYPDMCKPLRPLDDVPIPDRQGRFNPVDESTADVLPPSQRKKHHIPDNEGSIDVILGRDPVDGSGDSSMEYVSPYQDTLDKMDTEVELLEEEILKIRTAQAAIKALDQ